MKKTSVLGLEFFPGPAMSAVSSAQGLCVFPSGPGLATLDTDARYRAALVAATTRYVDSGFLALFWFLLSGQRLCRVSGLRFLQQFFATPHFRSHKVFHIHPSTQALVRNQAWAALQGFPYELGAHYVAPHYPATGTLDDPELITQVRSFQPQIIFIHLGSGTQEPLGAYLQKNLSQNSKTPLILCTGGAIDFLTGAQAPIPTWADRLFLGWLFRIFTTPPAQAAAMRVSPARRYLGAWRLLWLLVKYRRTLPQ